MNYDFFIAGRWRNKDKIREVLNLVRSERRKAYCFIENSYEGSEVEFKEEDDPDDFMQKAEALSQDSALTQEIFNNDMKAEKESESFILVLPAGISGHIELGVAYGMGKKCYGVGKPEKMETLYNVFDEIFETTEELRSWLKNHS